MNQFFLYWVDLAALLLSVFASIYLAIKAVNKRAKARGLAAFFLFFGPVAIAVHMFFHLTEILYKASMAIADGTFVYDFRFYALLLMGGLLAYLSLQLLQKMMAKCIQPDFRNLDLFRPIMTIILVSAPTIPFTPIGALPLLACLISLSALPFAVKNKKLPLAVFIKNPVPCLVSE